MPEMDGLATFQKLQANSVTAHPRYLADCQGSAALTGSDSPINGNDCQTFQPLNLASLCSRRTAELINVLGF